MSSDCHWPSGAHRPVSKLHATPAHSVSAEVRHNLYLATKEALNNAVKHSEASEIFFQLQLQPAAFTLIVRENGRGFDPAVAHPGAGYDKRLASGHGLHNIAQRLETIGGICLISC